MTKPFLRWVGGKTQLLPELLARVPKKINRYYEPFVGGGALFFALRPLRAHLSDSNAELMTTYRVVRDDVDMLIKFLRAIPYDKESYLKIRAEKLNNPVFAASRMIYLNKAGFNGLYRVNQKGEFNVPFGRTSSGEPPVVCDEESLRACSEALWETSINSDDFSLALDRVGNGDFVYCDPPYAPASATANFTGYQAGGFGWAEQERLSAAAEALAARGTKVMLSNADVPRVRELYAWASSVERVEARRSVNSRGDKRGKVGELIIRSWRDE